MKRAFLFLSISVMLLTALSCSPQKRVLYIYNWIDYVSPEIMRKFEEKFNCKIVEDYFDSNETMFARLRGGLTSYDLIFPSEYMASIMYKQNIVCAVDHARIPNLKYIDKEYLKRASDPNFLYSIPYTISLTGIGYNTKKVKSVPNSWSIFEDKGYAEKMTMLNDMRETIGAALKYLGFSLNTTNDDELAQAEALLLKWKKNLASFSVEDSKTGLASGNFFIIQQYNGDILKLTEKTPAISFFVPVEGTSMSIDVFTIPVNAANKDLAYCFINFLLEPENCAKNMEYIHYFSPNMEAFSLVGEKLRNNPAFKISPNLLKKAEPIYDLGENNVKYIKIWNAVKSRN